MLIHRLLDIYTIYFINWLDSNYSIYEGAD